MPRYDNGQDWVQIEGVWDKSMRELTVMDANDMTVGHAFAVSVTVDAHFTDRAGAVIDWRTDVLGLSTQQWMWWKRMIWKASREENVVPEA